MLIHKIQYEESDHGGHCDSHASIITGDNFNYPLMKAARPLGAFGASP